MSGMGAHTALNGGHRGEDGSAAVAPVVKAFTIPRLGDVSPWPEAAARPPWWQRWRHAVTSRRAAWQACLAAVPVVLVNAVAFGAQLGFWGAHLPVPAEAVLVALALESIAIYLAYLAHRAQLADDSALRLRLAAYGMALLIGALNYSHFMLPGWRPTVAAVTFGMMSAISPWLWSAYSRRASRDALKARGLIEPHAVRLGATRWTWHAVRSFRVMFRATWLGETDPAVAVTLPPLARSGPEVTDAAPVHVTPEVTPGLPVHVTPEPACDVTPAQPEAAAPPARQVRSRRKPAAKPPRISDADLKQDIRKVLAHGTAPTVSAVAKQVGRSRDRIRPLLEQVRAEG